MNERVFLAFRGLAILIHCFPGLGPSERHTPCVLCLLVDQKLALRWTDISQGKGSVPLCRNDGEPSPYAEATPQSKTPPSGLLGDGLPGLLAGPPLLGAQEVPPEWAFSCVYLLLAVLQEYIYSISCLSLLLTRDLFRVLPRTARCW